MIAQTVEPLTKNARKRTVHEIRGIYLRCAAQVSQSQNESIVLVSKEALKSIFMKEVKVDVKGLENSDLLLTPLEEIYASHPENAALIVHEWFEIVYGTKKVDDVIKHPAFQKEGRFWIQLLKKQRKSEKASRKEIKRELEFLEFKMTQEVFRLAEWVDQVTFYSKL